MRKDTRTAGKDLTGQRFGHLTVIEKTGQTENKYRLWLCRCDCGKEITVNTKRPGPTGATGFWGMWKNFS